MKGQVRSTAEMRFAASLEPCPSCGAAPKKLDFHGGSGVCCLSGGCPGCGKMRVFEFQSDVDPLKLPAPAYHELGGPAPSQIIAPAQFAAELARLEANLHGEPSALEPAVWSARYAESDRALICANELAKFPPADQPSEFPRRHERAQAWSDAFVADAPRTWMLRGGGELHVSEEVRGLLNQVATARPVRVADLERYLALRASLTTRTVVTAVQAWEDSAGVHAALALTPVGLSEVVHGTGRLAPCGETQSSSEVLVRGRRVRAEVDHAGGLAHRVTLHFGPPG